MIYKEITPETITLTMQLNEWKEIKKIIEAQLKFLSDCKTDLNSFPWELFSEGFQEEVEELDKDLMLKLHAVGINTYELER